MYLDELTMSEFKKKVTPNRIVILPIGATEEHGSHLPLSTDTIQPVYVAEQVAKRTGALIAPPIYYGLCSSTANFPGTISISFDTLYSLVGDVLSELARHGFKKIVVVSGHAGRLHMAAIRLAAEEIASERPDVKLMVLSDYDIAYDIKDPEIPQDDGHAGMIETSRVMAIKPRLVKGRGKRGKSGLPRFRVVGDAQNYFPSGVMGDPTKASAKKGKEWNAHIVGELTKLVKAL